MEINTTNKMLSVYKTSETKQIKQNYSFERIDGILNNFYNKYKDDPCAFIKDAVGLDFPSIQSIKEIYKNLSFQENEIMKFKGNIFVISNDYNYKEEKRAVANGYIFVVCKGDSYEVMSNKYRIYTEKLRSYRYKVHEFPQYKLPPGMPFCLSIGAVRVLQCEFNLESSDIQYINIEFYEDLCSVKYFENKNFQPKHIEFINNPQHEMHGQINKIIFKNVVISYTQTAKERFFKINSEEMAEKEFALKYPYYYSFFV